MELESEPFSYCGFGSATLLLRNCAIRIFNPTVLFSGLLKDML